MKSYIVYIIECENNSYYTGYTTDIKRRYQEHLEGSDKCKYTRANPPKKLAAYWDLKVSLSDIMRIEYAIKKLTKPNKTNLVKNKDRIKLVLEGLNIDF